MTFNPTARTASINHVNTALKAAMLVFVLMSATHANAADILNFPIVDDILCSVVRYLSTKFAPLIAVIVIGAAAIGHMLGVGKIWGTMIVVLLLIGIILGIGAIVARFPNVQATCLANF
ncbi:MAG: TrbC/VirB2 family protein [Burkholderiales bacterium]